MKVISIAFSVLLAQSVAANNSTDDYVDDIFNVTYAPTPATTESDVTYAPTSDDGVTITLDTPAPTPSSDDYASYAPTTAETDDYADETYAPTVGDNSPAPTATEEDDSPFIQDDMIESNETSTPAPYAEEASTPTPTIVNEEGDYVEEGDATPAPTSVSKETSTPTVSESDDYGSEATYAPSAGQDDYITVEEIDDTYSMDYSSTVSSVETMDNSGAVRRAATVILGVGCIAYYLI